MTSLTYITQDMDGGNNPGNIDEFLFTGKDLQDMDGGSSPNGLELWMYMAFNTLEKSYFV